jgi:succinyl-diaminopimelate desuccinylase
MMSATNSVTAAGGSQWREISPSVVLSSQIVRERRMVPTGTPLAIFVRGCNDSLSTAELLDGATPAFPLPARLTVTAVNGGDGYSVVPDLCLFNVDVRLTPAFDDRAAADLLRALAATVDTAWPDTRPTDVEITTSWPPFSLREDSPLRHALLDSAAALGLKPTAKIAGPSNIGNYLAGLGIPATAGFGVDYQGLHGTDERIRVDSIPAVQQTYHQALLTLLRVI